MTVKNISACRSAVYAPYGLADVKTDGLLDADRTTEASLCSPGWSGQAEYEFSILPEDFSKLIYYLIRSFSSLSIVRVASFLAATSRLS